MTSLQMHIFPRSNTHILNICVSVTKYMCIKPTTVKHLYIPDVRIYGYNVKQVKNEKYLGYIISSNCYDDDHIKKETRSTFARGNMLIRNFKHCSDNVKVTLYKTYCSSVYCCALISTYLIETIRKLHVAFNKTFKCLMSVPRTASASALFVSHRVDNFLILRRKLIYSFIKRIEATSNNLVRCIMDSEYFVFSKLRQEWDKVLYI